MTKEKLEAFNTELQALLEKHEVTLSVGYQIQVNDIIKDEKRTTSDKEA